MMSRGGRHLAAAHLFGMNTFVRRLSPHQGLDQRTDGRLPLKIGSDRRETLPKRVSDDSQHFIFRPPPKKNRRIFWIKKFVFRLFGVHFEEPQPNGPQNQLPRQILLQIDVSRDLYVQKNSDSFKFSDLRKIFTPVAGGRFPCGIKSTASHCHE